jgi:hypothetical protein
MLPTITRASVHVLVWAFLALGLDVAPVGAGSARQQAVAFRFDPRLAASVHQGLRASALGRERPLVRPVYVKCYRDARAFERPLWHRFGVGRGEARQLTAYYAGGGELHMRRGSCANARLFVQGVVRWDTAAAFSVLLHEALHRQGIRRERAATCLANDAVRWAGEAFGFSDRKADRARSLAFAYTARTAPREYRMSRHRCLSLVASAGLSWWRVARRPSLEGRFR